MSIIYDIIQTTNKIKRKTTKGEAVMLVSRMDSFTPFTKRAKTKTTTTRSQVATIQQQKKIKILKVF